MRDESADESAAREPASGDPVPTDSTFGRESLWRLFEPRQPDVDPLLGATLGGARLVRLVAEGGMGRVYEAEQERPRRPVAVKVMRPGLLSRDAARRFMREAEILGRMRHPGISQVHSAGVCDVAGTEVPYFVMEFIADARPITRFVRDRGLAVDDILRLFREVCDAVAHGHALGVVHRDLKPGNILVDATGHPRLIDFGIARGLRRFGGVADITELTVAGQFVGTLQYMSPEQVGGRPEEVGTASDVYSLGVVLFEMLTGSMPHRIADRPLVEAARMIAEEPAPWAATVDRRVPAAVAALVDRCLAKDGARRFRDAGELAAAIGRCLAGAGPRWVGPEAGWWRGLGRRSAGLRPGIRGIGVFAAAMLLAVAIPLAGPWWPAVPGTYRFSFRSVFQSDADRNLVEAAHMRKWEDKFLVPSVSYWGPVANDVEGRLVYRFTFPRPAARIRLRASSPCWDFGREPGGIGRGASAIEVSNDGSDWTTLYDNLEPRRWGEDWSVDGWLQESLAGTREFWVRMRFLTEDAPVVNGYSVAQFARSSGVEAEDVFAVEAELR